MKWLAAILIVLACNTECKAADPVPIRRDCPAWKPTRSREVTLAFQRLHPCPATGLRYGACPGYQKDHIVALCRMGPDTVENLQWLTIAEHERKTVHDIQLCKEYRREHHCN
jgi:hypothetical protein